jgi:hypothetical protein
MDFRVPAGTESVSVNNRVYVAKNGVVRVRAEDVEHAVAAGLTALADEMAPEEPDPAVGLDQPKDQPADQAKLQDKGK